MTYYLAALASAAFIVQLSSLILRWKEWKLNKIILPSKVAKQIQREREAA